MIVVKMSTKLDMVFMVSTGFFKSPLKMPISPLSKNPPLSFAALKDESYWKKRKNLMMFDLIFLEWMNEQIQSDKINR